MLTDIKHVFSVNPSEPAVLPDLPLAQRSAASATAFASVAGGIVRIGAGDNGFCFDNETPRHDALLHEHSHRKPAGHECGVPRVHHGRRLSRAVPVAGGRLGGREPARLEAAAVLERRPGSPSSRWADGARSIPARRSCMSATTRQTHSRAGSARGCRRNSSGSTRQRPTPSRATSSTPAGCTR